MVSAESVYAMLGNESLWQTAESCHQLLESAHIPHAILGGVAVCLHGYQRNTVDLDLLLRKDDAQTARSVLEANGLVWDDVRKEFRTPAGVALQFVFSEERAGPSAEVRLPDPGDERPIAELEGLPALSLARLIETKIACGQGSLRRTHKDFADVVELIAANQLGSSFAAAYTSLYGQFSANWSSVPAANEFHRRRTLVSVLAHVWCVAMLAACRHVFARHVPSRTIRARHSYCRRPVRAS